MRQLCTDYGVDFAKVRFWYDGYRLRNWHVYNPNAVVSLLLNKEFQSYWTVTASYEAIRPLINRDFDGLRTAIVTMLAGTAVQVNVNSYQNDMTSLRCKDDILTLLMHLGYLAYDAQRKLAYIPNEEIRSEFAGVVAEDRWSDFLEFQRQSESLLTATLRRYSITMRARSAAC